MTLGLAHSLVERRGLDGAHLAETFAARYEAEPWRGYGAGPPTVFRALRSGVRWDEAAGQLFGGAGSFGNGAAMRVAPVGLFAWRDPDLAVQLARTNAIVTHSHPAGIDGAVMQALAVTLLVRTSPGQLSSDALLDGIRPHLATEEFAETIHLLRSLLPDAPADAVVTHLGRGIAARESVPTALFAFLRSPDSFEETIAFAVGLGGDADTIAAMAGALSGVYLGAEAIPERWRTDVEGVSELVDTADRLFEIAAT